MKEQNIVLLSMSTLGDHPSENCYCFKVPGEEEEKYCFRGVSQLESGTKYFLRLFEDQGMTIDKILIVASDKSRKKLDKSIQKVVDGFVSAPLKENQQNAVGFFIQRMKDYICKEEVQAPKYEGKGKENVAEKREKVKEFEDARKSLKDNYPDLDSLFQVISLEDESDDEEKNQDAIYRCVDALCDIVREKAKEETKVNLYLNAQGARRYEGFVINAALKMLESELVHVESSVAIDFWGSNNQNGAWNEIVDTTMNDRIFEMVSGMNEFLSTGRGNTLSNFMEHAPFDFCDVEKKIIKTIREISDSISLCDIKKFDKGLEELNKALNEYRSPDIPNKNILFQTFVENLEKDYQKKDRPLIFEDGRDSETIAQVKWCLEKELYQQALTLIEAWMPKSIVTNKILYCGDDKKLEQYINEILAIYPNWLAGYMKTGDYIKPEYKELVFFKYMLVEPNKKEKNDARKSGKCIDNRLTITAGKVSSEKRKKILNQYIYCDEKIADLRHIYTKIKNERNNSNHALGTKFNSQTMAQLIQDFITKYEELLNSDIRFDAAPVIEEYIKELCLTAGKTFVNHTNHPLQRWSEKQKQAAELYGQIVEVPFPTINPDREDLIDKLVEDNLKKILAQDPAAVLCQGEFIYSYRMIQELKARGIVVVAAMSERKSQEHVKEDGTTERISIFEFKKFVEY